MPCLSLEISLEIFINKNTFFVKKYTYTLVFFELPEVAVNTARDCLRDGLFPKKESNKKKICLKNYSSLSFRQIIE